MEVICGKMQSRRVGTLGDLVGIQFLLWRTLRGAFFYAVAELTNYIKRDR